MNANIKTIVDFLNDRMDGEAVPLSNSVELQALGCAISELQRYNSKQELQELGLRVLGACIDRVRSNIAAEQTLRAFIQPGGGHV